MTNQRPISPLYIVDEDRLRANLRTLAAVRERTGCRILLALKAFALWRLFPQMRAYLDGVCVSSPWEARLGREEFGGYVHAYGPACDDAGFRELEKYCDAISFNSRSQWERFARPARRAGSAVSYGLRVNPEHSTQPPGHALYDPCRPDSHLGLRRSQCEGMDFGEIDGLHMHTLCEQGAEALEVTLDALHGKFADILPAMRWLNLGGGHHITRGDYDVDLLCRLIDRARDLYGVEVILEPGEAVVLHAGVLLCTVLDVISAGNREVAVLDISCTCHMPDVLEMPYRPRVALMERGGSFPGADDPRGGREGRHAVRLAGHSCLAGDVIGDYAFPRPLRVGDRLAFEDMAHYTMVKTTFFNGVRHPSIAVRRDGRIVMLREFTYEDYKSRLG
ncbi:carboxynorspermidine decarboxylase [Kiritimatiella glycovorans]|nr:carboxynorspermidine decarboxylase [Kiritimatiella glycovorans]